MAARTTGACTGRQRATLVGELPTRAASPSSQAQGETYPGSASNAQGRAAERLGCWPKLVSPSQIVLGNPSTATLDCRRSVVENNFSLKMRVRHSLFFNILWFTLWACWRLQEAP